MKGGDDDHDNDNDDDQLVCLAQVFIVQEFARIVVVSL